MGKTGCVKQEMDDDDRTKRHVVLLEDVHVLLAYYSQDLFIN
jgi:hypothetical protein